MWVLFFFPALLFSLVHPMRVCLGQILKFILIIPNNPEFSDVTIISYGLRYKFRYANLNISSNFYISCIANNSYLKSSPPFTIIALI